MVNVMPRPVAVAMVLFLAQGVLSAPTPQGFSTEIIAKGLSLTCGELPEA